MGICRIEIEGSKESVWTALEAVQDQGGIVSRSDERGHVTVRKDRKDIKKLTETLNGFGEVEVRVRPVSAGG